MSVVNKMLQDLEARQAGNEGVNADYQAPEKSYSKWPVIILLVIAMLAILIALTANDTWFAQDNTQPIEETLVNHPPAAPKKKKMLTAAPQAVAAVEPKQETTALVDNEVTHLTSPNLPGTELDSTLPLDPITEVTTNIADTPEPQTQNESRIPATQSAEQPSAHFVISNSSQKSQALSLKQRIAESLDNDDLPLAKKLLLELLEKEPDNLNARKKLASLYFAQGFYAQSQQLLTQGIEQQSEQTDLRLMLARLYMAKKNTAKAMEVLEGFQPDRQQNDKNAIEYLAYRAALAQQLDKTQIAQADYQTLTQKQPTQAKWWLGLAIAQDRLGDTALALQAYNNASTLNQLDGSVNDFVQQRIQVLVGAP